MKRRVFLGVGLAAAAAAAGALWLTRRGRGHRDYAVRLMRRRLSYCHVAEDELERFARDFWAAHPRHRRLAESAPALRRPWRRDERLLALDDELCASFLMSSDFFRAGADESRPVRYLALYDPRRTGCTNPFWKGFD